MSIFSSTSKFFISSHSDLMARLSRTQQVSNNFTMKTVKVQLGGPALKIGLKSPIFLWTFLVPLRNKFCVFCHLFSLVSSLTGLLILNLTAAMFLRR